MNESDAIAVIAAAWTVVQVTRATYTYRAGLKKAENAAAVAALNVALKETPKP